MEIDILIKIHLMAVFGAIVALFSYFLDYCFRPGAIFGKWLPFLAKTNIKLFHPKRLNETEPFKGHADYENMLIDNAQDCIFFKVLGGCIICTNIWIGFISFIFVGQFYSWLYAIPYILFSSFILRKIVKI